MALLYQKTLPSSSFKAFAKILCIILSHSFAALTLATNETTPAVIIFGDSIMDTGINNYMFTVCKSNFPPYGKDFMGGKPTGRFSNGKVPSDLIAEAFGVKMIVPAYLDPDLQLQDLLTGVSFASGASGYDPLTPKLQNVLSFSDQLELFKEYKSKIIAAIGNEITASILSKSIFLVVVGNNYLGITYFYTPLRRLHYNIPTYTDLMLKFASNFFQELYALGARTIGVFNLLPVGCLPIERTIFGGLERTCYETENQAAMLFNSKLSSLVDSLNKRLPEAQLSYLDIYNPLLSLIQNPDQHGFEVVDKGCCGTGTFEVRPLCNKLSGTCDDVSKYIFWDSTHPTEKAYRILTSIIVKELKTYEVFIKTSDTNRNR